MVTIDNTVLNQLRGFSLYSNCGKQFQKDVPPFVIEQTRKVEEVNRNLQSLDWENFLLEARNTLTIFLHNYQRSQYQLWNDITKAYKDEIVSLEILAKQFSLFSGVDQTEVDSFNWIILAMCMENHYRKLNHKIPILYLHLLPIYEAGHIPCGWKGSIDRKSNEKSMDLSKGVLLIY